MERGMCSFLEWILCIKSVELETFKRDIKKEYNADFPPQWVSSSIAILQASPAV